MVFWQRRNGSWPLLTKQHKIAIRRIDDELTQMHATKIKVATERLQHQTSMNEYCRMKAHVSNTAVPEIHKEGMALRPTAVQPGTPTYNLTKVHGSEGKLALHDMSINLWMLYNSWKTSRGKHQRTKSRFPSRSGPISYKCFFALVRDTFQELLKEHHWDHKLKLRSMCE